MPSAKSMRLATALLLFVIPAVVGAQELRQAEPGEELRQGDPAQELRQIKRGHAHVQVLCARCHAVGATGDSPHANAPPFRLLARSMDFDSFVTRLRDGLMAGHSDMPEFRFRRRDARAIAAYLVSIQSPSQ